ncbi:hypothetical protein [Los Azufres archaeal virus 1]|nr:hypothetical protein [Los Azufres archaeal virus 1]
MSETTLKLTYPMVNGLPLVSGSNGAVFNGQINLQSGSYFGPITSNETASIPIIAKRFSKLYIWISGVSGTSPTIQFVFYGDQVSWSSPQISSSPYYLVIEWDSERGVYANLNGQQIIKLPETLSALFRQGLGSSPSAYFQIQVGGTSPSFTVDSWVVYE